MIRNLKISVLLMSVVFFSANCAQKKVATIPSITPSSTVTDNTQNYTPATQGTDPNQSYYGNGAYVSNDTSSFATPAPTTTSSTTSTATDTSSSSLDDFGSNLPNIQPYTPPAGSGGSSYTLTDQYLITQSSAGKLGVVTQFLPSVDKWQAVGVASDGANILISVSGTSNFAFGSGTVLSMPSDTGAGVKKIGSTLLGSKNPIGKTVKGITVDSSGKIYAVDETKNIYLISKANSVITSDAGITGGIDINSVGSALIVATTSGLKKYDPTQLTGKQAVTGTNFGPAITPTGGIGTDKEGNVYVVAGNVIKKVTSSGEATDIVKDLADAVDVAVDNSGKICVLTKDSVLVYDNTGKSITTLSSDFISPKAITASGNNLFVADYGTSYADSMIHKFSILSP